MDCIERICDQQDREAVVQRLVCLFKYPTRIVCAWDASQVFLQFVLIENNDSLTMVYLIN